MSNVHSDSRDHENCPLCGRHLKEPLKCVVGSDNLPVYPVECEVCGGYRIPKFLFLSGELARLSSDDKSRLSAIIKRHYVFADQRKTIESEDCEGLRFQGPDRSDIPGKVRYLLRYVAHKSRFPGDKIVLNRQTDYPICFAGSPEEFEFYVQYAKESTFLDGKVVDMRSGQQNWLTPQGWEEMKRIPTLESPYAFVAMSFSKEGHRAAVLSKAFDEAIRPAIEDDAGYQRAIRIDQTQFLGDIVFEIIARIKECRFVVADVTEHRHGVYFEAGYAMGMSLPVIWMCHRDDMGHAHFDTSHLNHIVWDDIGELRKSLANRILATIGKGPRKV